MPSANQEHVIDPEALKPRKYDDLKRKALLMARKKEQRKVAGLSSKMSSVSSDGLSDFKSDTASEVGISDVQSQSSRSVVSAAQSVSQVSSSSSNV